MDVKAIKQKLQTLQTQTTRKSNFVKPQAGRQTYRIVPSKHYPQNPFVELYFHYNIGNKTYISPISFDRPDPIQEFAQKLKTTGDSDDWRLGRKMEPKLRTFVPVVVRGEENEGVRWWGFGKTVYTELLKYIADPDWGDISDPTAGRDFVVEVTPADEAGTTYPKTNIIMKPKEKPLSDNPSQSQMWLEEQSDIADLYTELTYDELDDVLQKWLNGEVDDEPTTKPSNSDTNSSDSNSNTDDDIDLPFKESDASDEIKSKFNKLFEGA